MLVGLRNNLEVEIPKSEGGEENKEEKMKLKGEMEGSWY